MRLESMLNKLQWKFAFLFVFCIAWGGFMPSAHAWYFGLCSNWYCGAEGEKLPEPAPPTFATEDQLDQDGLSRCKSLDQNSADGKCPNATFSCQKGYKFCVMAQCPASGGQFVCPSWEALQDNCYEGTAHGDQTIYNKFHTDCTTEANTGPIFDYQPTPRGIQISSNQYYTDLDKVCYPLNPQSLIDNVANKTACVQKEMACTNNAGGYGDCFKTQAGCNFNQTVNAYVCNTDPVATCSSMADTAKNAILNDPDCQVVQPQCDDTNAATNCALSNPQEAACNDVSCVNGRCHYVGKASGEYQTVQETPTTRAHFPLPTNHPSCTYPNKPYAFCTNSGMSSLDYCFPADQPLASNTGSSGSTGGSTGSSGTNCSSPTIYIGFPNLNCMNFTPSPGSTLVCSDTNKHATQNCANYNMDPVLVAGQPAFPPDCCQ